ncbi:hypothetical protein IB024_05045 [Brucella sp. 6810]|uniref:hypothetical protein n=1 Tax=Brucella sp. 6810 TaxID=2769351 RepID=UPI00165C3AC8|nr:hypothetical protein [Brucella sp. 6810]QNQ63108.1 hypothetical protein IB024_05045 [Brucella sp. 6810]
MNIIYIDPRTDEQRNHRRNHRETIRQTINRQLDSYVRQASRAVHPTHLDCQIRQETLPRIEYVDRHK